MKILLTGATGYIGRRLKRRLLEDESAELNLFVRNRATLDKKLHNRVNVFEGDSFDKASLEAAMQGVDTAYYLIHSLNSKDYKNKDRILAQNFIDCAAKCGVKRVIYLGGLGVKDANTSTHLLSRLETGEVLASRPEEVQTIWLRAGVIIGSGSTSFEIIRNLVEKLPVMTTPKWVDTKAQPIGVDDVISYLDAAKDLQETKSLVVDIGAEQLSYRQMMLGCARALGLKRVLIPVPMLSINISSYWLNLFTPVPFTVAKALIEGLKSEVVIQNDNAKRYFPQIRPLSYEQSVQKAIEQIRQDQVISRWNDVGGKVWERDHDKEIADAVFVDRQQRDISYLSKAKVYESFTSLGGEQGWFDYDWLWELRGIADKLIGGVGLKRGRRSECDLRIGDCLDFWKVVELQKDERLLLYAQMKLPGEAWLEFKITEGKLLQSAYFYPKGVWGRVYWYAMLPFHYFIFKNMIDRIVERAH